MRSARPSLPATIFALTLVAMGAFAGVSLLFDESWSPGEPSSRVVVPGSAMLRRWISAWPFGASPRFTVTIRGVEHAGRVSDGDTLIAGAQWIRLHGIDAPERGQTCVQQGREIACGRFATAALRDFLAGQHVVCHASGTDRYGRDLAICIRGDGADVNRHMVASGWAIAYRRYSRAYEQAEDDARWRRVGLWAGTFVSPEDWRARQL